jgi:Eukaryotic aspartyl protease
MKKQKSSKKYKVGASGKKPLRIPITNFYDGNDYTAQVFVGSKRTPVNVILDTGSSTFAVSPKVYDGLIDKSVKPTTYAQLVEYGTGGWAGPMVNTKITMGKGKDSVVLNKSHIAITSVEARDNFVGAQGIMGLAFSGLNSAYDLTEVLQKQKATHSHPWPFKVKDFKAFNKHFGHLQEIHNIPSRGVLPYFTELEEQHGVKADKFALYTLRSRTHHAHSDKKRSVNDPLNKGFFILGGGEEQTDLYEGNHNSFLTAEIYHHRYFNTKLLSVQVDGFPAVDAKPLQKRYVAADISNSIIDSGTNTLILAKDVYRYVMKCFGKIDPGFIKVIKESDDQKTGTLAKFVDLAAWPDIHFTFSGEQRSQITLTIKPDTYWQLNTPSHGRAVFQIGSTGDEPENQSVFGLPLFNNYYTIFDRSMHHHGVVRFAPIKK